MKNALGHQNYLCFLLMKTFSSLNKCSAIFGYILLGLLSCVLSVASIKISSLLSEYMFQTSRHYICNFREAFLKYSQCLYTEASSPARKLLYSNSHVKFSFCTKARSHCCSQQLPVTSLTTHGCVCPSCSHSSMDKPGSQTSLGLEWTDF